MLSVLNTNSVRESPRWAEDMQCLYNRVLFCFFNNVLPISGASFPPCTTGEPLDQELGLGAGDRYRRGSCIPLCITAWVLNPLRVIPNSQQNSGEHFLSWMTTTVVKLPLLPTRWCSRSPNVTVASCLTYAFPMHFPWFSGSLVLWWRASLDCCSFSFLMQQQ